MELNDYQREARKTAVFPKGDIIVEQTGIHVSLGSVYCALKLGGEGGEYSEKLGKLIRGDYLTDEEQKMARHARMMELGDIMWYVANAAEQEGYTLEEIAKANLQKLADRQSRGVLKGSGDKR